MPAAPHRTLISCLGFLPVLALAFTAEARGAAAEADRFEIRTIAEGVHVALRQEPPGLWFESNSVFIVNDEDVVVVDTNLGPASARRTLAALRRLTGKPVRWVVNTHWHEDHILGNQVYRDAFPGVEFVGHASTRADLSTVGASNRRGSVEGGGAGFVAMIDKALEEGRSFTGEAIDAEERAAYASDRLLVEGYLREAPGFEIVYPTIAVEDRLTIRSGRRTIEILHLGGGHTGADLVVHLPAEKIAIVGDLVSWPIPLVGSTSHPAAFAGALARLLELNPAVIVPGHGPVGVGLDHVRTLQRLLESIRDQTAAAVARGETLEQARRSVDLSEFRRILAGASRFRGFVFDNYVAGPGVAAAFREAGGKG